MSVLLHIIQKEFIQIARNKAMRPLLIAMPIIQLIILGNAATFDVKQINLMVVDEHPSEISRTLISHFTASGFFTLVRYQTAASNPLEVFESGEAEVILTFPKSFGESWEQQGTEPVQLAMDAVDGNAASLAGNYAQAILQKEKKRWNQRKTGQSVVFPIQVLPMYWYNPELIYSTYIVPGILVLLVTLLGMFLTSMNIVFEKEMGTIEQLNVTPITKFQFIAGKLIPFWILGIVEFIIGLGIAKLIFDLPFVGSIPLLVGVVALYMLVVLGLGLFISTETHTMQQALFISWFLLVIFILMSGLFTPIDSMPQWAQLLTLFNPVAHFIEIMRRVLLKGASLQHILIPVGILIGMAVGILTLAVLRYSKKTE